MKIKIFAIFLLLTALVSCQFTSKEITLNHPIPNGIWNKFAPIAWDLQIPEGKRNFEAFIKIETGENFSSEKVRFQLLITGSDGEERNQAITLLPKTMEASLQENGNQILLQKLPTAGTFKAGVHYQIELVSLMPYLETPGIQKLQLIFKVQDGQD